MGADEVVGECVHEGVVVLPACLQQICDVRAAVLYEAKLLGQEGGIIA